MDSISVERASSALKQQETLALALAIADANWFTTESLFRELDRDGVSTLLLTCIDYVNSWRRGERPWNWGKPLRELRPRLSRRELVLPSGWMKSYPRLGMQPIRQAIGTWRRQLASGPLALVMTYPHYLYLRDMTRPDKSVYFNVDDYSLYWPAHAETIVALERKAVAESDLTVCTSRLRFDQLRAAAPSAAHKIRHLPHGSPAHSVEPSPFHAPAEPPSDLARVPRPLLGYVGSMEDRVDWVLLNRLAETFSQSSLVLVGRMPNISDEPWQDDVRRLLARSNVFAMGWRSQEMISRYNRAFDVVLIPYRTDHPFNIACCPTKIMDSMGSGRPIVSTDLPECRLYRHLFDVAIDDSGFLAAVERILKNNSDDGRAALRHDHALQNTCGKVADRLIDWLLE
jgi:teichuronic acid biosynthesis glycosyltransferase TuaH